MRNRDKVFNVIARTCLGLDLEEAGALRDQLGHDGLIPVDLPKPEMEVVDVKPFYQWQMESVPDEEVRIEGFAPELWRTTTNVWGEIANEMVYTPAQARELAYALLAAADMAEGNQGEVQP